MDEREQNSFTSIRTLKLSTMSMDFLKLAHDHFGVPRLESR